MAADMTLLEVNGFAIRKGWLDPAAQAAMLVELREVIAAAPFFAPLTPWGKPMSVRMTSAGRYGWFTDRKGYRYVDRHPEGTPWPPIPPSVLGVWRALVSAERDPDCCLVNYYAASAKMGMHRDSDEKDFAWPVLSISLGDPARFRMGGARAATRQRRRARERRRRRIRRPGAPRLPWHRPHPRRRLAAAARRGTDQPDVPGGRLKAAGTSRPTGSSRRSYDAPEGRSPLPRRPGRKGLSNPFQ